MVNAGPMGVLALQGGFAEHQAMLDSLDADNCQVRTYEQLQTCRGLIIPGGESTTMSRLMRHSGLDQAIIEFVQAGGIIWGTCAGAILLSREADHLPYPPLDLIDVTVQRNAFGRQVDSFVVPLDVAGLLEPLQAIFIRAPVLTALGQDVRLVASLPDGRAAAAANAQVLVTAFHPELGQDPRMHQHFLSMSTPQ